MKSTCGLGWICGMHQRNSVMIFFILHLKILIGRRAQANSMILYSLVLQSFTATETNLTICLDNAAALVQMYALVRKESLNQGFRWNFNEKNYNSTSIKNVGQAERFRYSIRDSPVYDAGTVTTCVTVGCILPSSIRQSVENSVW